ncbi:hypothetical protein B4114_2584 [Geobacillus stearothermophilus]|uniref:Uncharacterized protein n=1 Tax=Geobacillus stearothermophilus TaxID=1422 RepID=A0A150NBT4_GEOSE|nr:hypothetical protein B4114_2584 [Geobacillus stearothermophilus]
MARQPAESGEHHPQRVALFDGDKRFFRMPLNFILFRAGDSHFNDQRE